MRRRLSERAVATLLKRRPRKREDYYCTSTTGFLLRLTPAGSATYAGAARWGGGPFSKREIGNARVMKYATALATVKDWLELDAQGKDPRAVEAERAREAERLKGYTVASVIETFIAECVEGVQRPRQIPKTKRLLAIIAKAWGGRIIHSITGDEVKLLIKSKHATPGEARTLWTATRRVFGWAKDQTYGLEVDPTFGIKFKSLIKKGGKPRERVLTVDEMQRLWAAVQSLNQPMRQAHEALILSGLRLNEAAGAKWSEIDLSKRVWLIPGNRMKMGKPFAVPICDRLAAVLHSLPRNGEYVFSVSGRNPIRIGNRVKRRIDAAAGFSDWVNHDIRRGLATALAERGVSDTVCDLLLAHVRPGITGNYNYSVLWDKRVDALTLWASLVVPDNIVPMRRAV